MSHLANFFRRNDEWQYKIRPIIVSTMVISYLEKPRMGGSVVSMSDACPGGCEFHTRLRQTFFPMYFRLSPLKHVRKVVGGFGEKVLLVIV